MKTLSDLRLEKGNSIGETTTSYMVLKEVVVTII